MKNKRRPLSLIKLSIQAYNLLSTKQQAKFIRNIIGSVTQACLEVVSLTAIIPLFFGIISDRGFSFLNNLKLTLNWQITVLSIVLIIFFKNLISLWLNRNQLKFIHEIFIEFAEQLYHRFYHQSWLDYLQENSAETMRKIRQAPFDFANHVLQGYLTLITDLIICVLMGSVLIWIDFRIVLVLIILSAPIFTFYYWFRKKVITKMNSSFRDLTPKANIAITQGIDSFAETKIYHKEDFFINYFMKFNNTSSKYLSNLKLSTSLPSRLFETVGVLSFASVIVYSKLNPISEESILIILGLFSIAMYRVIPSLNRILISLSQILAYAYSVSELKESFEEPASRSIQNNSGVPFKKNIQLSNISYRYQNSQSDFLFQDLNFTISKGEFLVIEGASGVGKTTLMHLLTGLITDYQGKILIDENILLPDTLTQWQTKLGLVPQVPVVLQESILQNIAFGEAKPEIDISRAKEALLHAHLFEFVDSLPLKLETPVGENGQTLSGGQRLRLVLARALYRNPEVLVLDEATSQLDQDTKQKILTSLKELATKGTTIILASHDSFTRNFASRVLRLENNKIYEVAKESLYLDKVQRF